MDFAAYFEQLASGLRPHDWQAALASDSQCSNRLIRVPTGFGKTLGVLSVWLWHRVANSRESWPRRLVWCLPMRVLVEQTEEECRSALRKSGLLWEGGEHVGKVGVHLLMGGADPNEWCLYPEYPAVLIGTQDMLLSRAMNRGYASPRARWPMEFGLLNQDCLWIMDEVQLMDVGLATSFQLQAFRGEDEKKARFLRPCRTWWMSATLQSAWMNKSPDTAEMAADVSRIGIPDSGRTGHLWEDVRKGCALVKIKGNAELCRLIAQRHLDAEQHSPGPTLVVVNTVERATTLYDILRGDRSLRDAKTEIRLVHSRFRPAEKRAWRQQFLNRQACIARKNRIVIATQVVEAGVDISATLLVTELAAWASLVQRFGRSARWGGEATVIVFEDAQTGPPYAKEEVGAAREALESLSDVSPLRLEAFEEANPGLLPRLYPFEPRHLLLRQELEELFDTTPDLSGADIDVSRFIRLGDERDLHVFWTDVTDAQPPSDMRPGRDALCAVPFLKARDWLCGKETSTKKAPRLRKGKRAWVWDWLEGGWRLAERRDLYPGQTVAVACQCGGYETDKGWTPESTRRVEAIGLTSPALPELADGSQDDESLSELEWQTIAVHGRETGALARQIAALLAPIYADLFSLAGRCHDVGKVHAAFHNSIVGQDRPRRMDLAKAPKSAWLDRKHLYPMEDGRPRKGFRHELGSALAFIEVLKRRRPDHEALLGPWAALLAAARMPPKMYPLADGSPTIVEQEILRLDADAFNLAAYLICAHHGKVRLAWHPCPADQASEDEQLRIRGLRNGDVLPPLLLATADGSFDLLPGTEIDLSPAAAGLSPRTGPSWTERVLGLLTRHGPFTLAWLEALLRAADQRASRAVVHDELLEEEVRQ